MSIKLDERKIEIDGQVYTLRCNMSVLDRVQEAAGGAISDMYSLPAYSAVFTILKAMLDDFCEDENLPEVPMKRLKKLYSPAALGEIGVFRMFTDSLVVVRSEDLQKQASPDESERPGN